MANGFSQTQLALLYQLQKQDQELLSIHQKLKDIPDQIAQLEAEVVQYEEDKAVKSAELEAVEKEQRSKTRQIEANAEQREKHETEQQTVKTNEAYHALGRQIEFLDEQDAEAEDAILNLMEQADTLTSELADLEVKVDREKQKTATETEALRQEIEDLKKANAEQMKQRNAFLPKIDKPLATQYQRWMKAEVAKIANSGRIPLGFIALCRNGTCESCRIAIQPQTLKEAEKYEKPVYCSSCKRLLYVEPATPDADSP